MKIKQFCFVQEGMIVLLPQPHDYVEHLAGLQREIWQDLDTTAYLEQERGDRDQLSVE